VRRILVTGMSGTGKSSALAELAPRMPPAADGGTRRLARLLDEEGPTL
jgi:hypothetical protein